MIINFDKYEIESVLKRYFSNLKSKNCHRLLRLSINEYKLICESVAIFVII